MDWLLFLVVPRDISAYDSAFGGCNMMEHF